MGGGNRCIQLVCQRFRPVNCRPSVRNYQLSHTRFGVWTSDLRGGRRGPYHCTTVVPLMGLVVGWMIIYLWLCISLISDQLPDRFSEALTVEETKKRPKFTGHKERAGPSEERGDSSGNQSTREAKTQPSGHQAKLDTKVEYFFFCGRILNFAKQVYGDLVTYIRGGAW